MDFVYPFGSDDSTKGFTATRCVACGGVPELIGKGGHFVAVDIASSKLRPIATGEPTEDLHRICWRCAQMTPEALRQQRLNHAALPPPPPPPPKPKQRPLVLRLAEFAGWVVLGPVIVGAVFGGLESSTGMPGLLILTAVIAFVFVCFRPLHHFGRRRAAGMLFAVLFGLGISAADNPQTPNGDVADASSVAADADSLSSEPAEVCYSTPDTPEGAERCFVPRTPEVSVSQARPQEFTRETCWQIEELGRTAVRDQAHDPGALRFDSVVIAGVIPAACMRVRGRNALGANTRDRVMFMPGVGVLWEWQAPDGGFQQSWEQFGCDRPRRC